jgi:hypothetical protein
MHLIDLHVVTNCGRARIFRRNGCRGHTEKLRQLFENDIWRSSCVRAKDVLVPSQTTVIQLEDRQNGCSFRANDHGIGGLEAVEGRRDGPLISVGIRQDSRKLTVDTAGIRLPEADNAFWNAKNFN